MVALWRETPRASLSGFEPAGPSPEVLKLQGSAAVALRDWEHSDRERAARARGLAHSGAVVSARLVASAPGASHGDPYDLCDFEMEVDGSSGTRYRVRLRAGMMAAAMLPATCTCPDFARRGLACKHIGAAWCCAVEGNFAELVELSAAAVQREAAGRREPAARAAAPRVAPAGGDPAVLSQAVRELRASEAEVVSLRAEVRQLQAQAATASLGKATVDFLSATETLHEWRRACGAAESYVYVACFTFDHPQVVTSLLAARERGVTVRVMFSQRDRGTTNNQGARLQRLRGCGCEVRGHRSSRQHAKVLMTEREIVLGSCNFTEASLANSERGVLLHELAEDVMLAQKDWYDRLFDAALPFKEGLGEVVPPSPER